MEMALWFVAGYAVRGILSTLFHMGAGVRIMKVVEIQALTLLSRAQDLYYESQSLLDLAAEGTGDSETLQKIKVTKNMLTIQHHDWQNKTVETMHSSLESHKGWVKWRTWKEAMEYLAVVKKDERLMRLLTVRDKKEKK